MEPYIFMEKNGIHIIDLQKTISAIREAYEAVRQAVLANKSVLFVGTKKQAQLAVQREAEQCGMFYVNNRWLGGMLTNFSTIKKSLQRLKKIEKMEVDGTFESLTKKEVAKLNKERAKLEKNLGGIKEMRDLPGIMFVIDTRKEAIAIAEAQRCGIPIVAVVDTNSNPDGIDYPIPGNDDAIRAITLFTQIISKAVVEADNEIGLEVIESMQDEDETTASDDDSTIHEGREDEEGYRPAPRIEREEKSPVAAYVAEDEEESTEKEDLKTESDDEDVITDTDYSEYDPSEDDQKRGLPEQEFLEDRVADEAGIDEERLYGED